METIRYQGRNVYTHSNQETTERDLRQAQVEKEQIDDAYFFTIDGDRFVQKIDFDKPKIEANNSGLMVQVKGRNGSASVAVAGLSRILEFMVDANVVGKDLTTLKGKPVTTYARGMCLIGISPK